ncbi:MAG: response regulator, partial [Alphaproteobacteria bacterium]
MKVLIAEDDSTSAIVLRKALEKLGHEAIVAMDGERAYALLSQDTAFEYRVVISDWMMPGMDGLELTRKLRTERKETDPYRFIVLLTARGRPEDRRQGLEAGADDFMVKPLDMGDLIPRLSVAERMLELEDAVAASKGASAAVPKVSEKIPTPDNLNYAQWRDSDVVREELARDKDSPSLVISPEDQAACATLFSALIDTYKATKVHFEPTSDGNYRLRIRTPDDKTLLLGTQPSTFSGAIGYLEAFLQSSPYGFARLPLSSQREIRLQI